MKQFVILRLQMIMYFIASFMPFNSLALKIDNTHYRFCVMDNATIIDQDAVKADHSDQLPFILNASWRSQNGVLLNGTESYVSKSNGLTDVNVLMTELYDGKRYGVCHKWYKGFNGVAYEQYTYFYISIDAPEGVSIDGISSRMLVGEENVIKTSLVGSFTPFSGDGYFEYNYSSSDNDVISVLSDKIVAHKEGYATIKVEVYAKNKRYTGSYYIGSAKADIEVVKDMSPTNISLDFENITMNVGDKERLTPILTPNDAKTTITWGTSNPNVATVEDGNVIAVGKGKATISATTSNGLSSQCTIIVLEEQDYRNDLNINDVNRTWGISRDEVILNQPGNYYLYQNDETNVIFTSFTDDNTKLFLSYKFDGENGLCASVLSFPKNVQTKLFADKFFSDYEVEAEVESGVEVKTMGREIITIDTSSSLNGDNIISIGFSYFEPLQERDDCVDLGLSVRWATMNLGADKPDGVGDFYAWSETRTKSEYWRENYSYCNNNSNQYIFDYTNPSSKISGSKYDVATEKLGEGWRIPSLAETNELITKCSWELIEIDGQNVYRVTGPNGNSIIIPIVGWKKQNQRYSTTQLHLSLGECSSRSSESCYVLTTERTGGTYRGSIGVEWKAWGYNIRPVYTK